MILRRSRGCLAIDLGSRQITVAAIENDGPRARVLTLEREPLEPGVIVAGDVMDYHFVVQSLRGLRERLGLKGRVAVTSVSGRNVIVKRVKMDRMREQEARQVIRWEAEQHVPFDMDNVSLDFEILDPDGDGLQMEVLIVAAKKELVETRIRLFEESGFRTGVIDIDAFAVQTAFEHNYENAGSGVYCLVNVGYEVTNISLVEDGRPILTRDTSDGKRQFVEALVVALGVTSEEAEDLLHGGHELYPEARQALDAAMATIVMPVERARSFLSTSEEDRELAEIVLSGEGAGIPGLRSALNDKLQVPVNYLDPLRALEKGAGVMASAIEPSERATLAVPIGLGLRGDS
ncbi:MAG: type IV pilus assembly protein PilM [Gemmatimonadetes bacterium]|nr:type IV pilus assembly protein PilM [Gemmatimonadota bacterium]